MAITLTYKIQGGDFTNAGNASSKVKKVLKELDVDARKIKHTVVALYEAEVNVVAHAYEGIITAVIDEKKIEIEIRDKGPGIADIGLAMQEGYSTASKRVREMGFGAGMGLPNIKKNTDFLEITSCPGEWVNVKMINYF